MARLSSGNSVCDALISQLNDEQYAVFETVWNGYSVFLTGKAGAGKSHTVSTIRDIFVINNYPLVVVGSTGISVVNIEGHGTFNSYFGIGAGFKSTKGFGTPTRTLDEYLEVVANCYSEGYKRLRTLPKYKEGLLIIVDEVSMMDSLLLSAVNDALNKRGIDKQWLLVGDVMQFPPVGGNYFFENVKVVEEEGNEVIDSILKTEDFIGINLQKNVRAEGDVDFSNALDLMRLGKTHIFPSVIKERWDASYNQEAPEDALHIFYMNKLVRERNDRKTKELINKGAGHRNYKATINTRKRTKSGDTWIYKNKQFNETIFEPVGLNMVFCIGMPVMLRKNLYEGGQLLASNGSMGIVTKLGHTSVSVHFDKEDKVIDIFPHKFTSGDGGKDPKLGTFMQLPLCPAFAITFHKSQGLTFRHPVVVHPYMKDRYNNYYEIKAPNALYVAVSRLTTSEDLYFHTMPELSEEDAYEIAIGSYKTDPKALRFMKALQGSNT